MNTTEQPIFYVPKLAEFQGEDIVSRIAHDMMERAFIKSEMNKKVDFFAREPHHQRHARAIYEALPVRYRGVFTDKPKEIVNDTVATFAYGDLKMMKRQNKKIIYSEHGVGMFYNTEHPSYAGSLEDRENVILRLVPNETIAAKERETLKCPVKVIGVPKMDEWANRNFRVRRHKPTVAISFHWDCLVCPETRSSFRYYEKALSTLRENFKVIGHGHPRIMNRLESIYRRNGIVIERDFDKVLAKADVYICDNSSTMFEFAFTERPVVVLNIPAYRKNVTHPGNPRFWKYADMGVQVEKPEDLVRAVSQAVRYYESYSLRIQEMKKEVFTFTDGRCSERAAGAIVEAIGGVMYPYEMYCSGCQTVLAHLGSLPKPGDMIMAGGAVNLDGTFPSAGDVIKCQCEPGTKRSFMARPRK